MSWSDGRSPTPSAGLLNPSGMSTARRDALDRVDGLLRGLAADKLLQDDLRHPDVQKALQHWTGHRRLSQDEADELMEDNYRINAVFGKMAGLQGCCKLAGIGLPLAQVLSGTGLNPDTNAKNGRAQEDVTKSNQASSSGTRGQGSASVGSGNTINVETNSTGQSAASSELRNPSSNRSGKRSPDSSAMLPEEKGLVPEAEVSWGELFVEALWKVIAVCVCAVLFAGTLRYFRGDNPLGFPGDKDGSGEELRGGDEF